MSPPAAVRKRGFWNSGALEYAKGMPYARRRACLANSGGSSGRRRLAAAALWWCLALNSLLALGSSAAVDEGELCVSTEISISALFKDQRSCRPSCPAAAILRKLRQAAHDTDPAWLAHLPGWHPNDTRPPCSWIHVSCHQLHVVAV